MPEEPLHPAALGPDELLAQCEVRRQKRSGPGGQHRNKVETAIVLHHLPTGVRAEASERRSQAENLSRAVFRLRVNLAFEIRTPRPCDAQPSPLWRSRCCGGRIAINASHDDFPTLLAEVLDTLTAAASDPKPAAARLGCTVSQLVKFLKKEPRALSLVNRRRHNAGMHPLQ
ncbi:MAG TPA: peptide chain release factor-like protein [Thermoguttaceae bacterium]|nr:peptide chain release factor-like protein [Thermoguttaceae bacterium]